MSLYTFVFSRGNEQFGKYFLILPGHFKNLIPIIYRPLLDLIFTLIREREGFCLLPLSNSQPLSNLCPKIIHEVYTLRLYKSAKIYSREFPYLKQNREK